MGPRAVDRAPNTRSLERGPRVGRIVWRKKVLGLWNLSKLVALDEEVRGTRVLSRARKTGECLSAGYHV